MSTPLTQTYSDYLVSDVMDFLITLERFVGPDVHSEDDERYDFNLQYWIQKPLECWPRDDAEAKLIATSIATYNFNNYKVLKRYHELDADDKAEVDSWMFLVGMVWKGTCPSFYKLSIRNDLVKAVRVGKYTHVPTGVYKYTPVLPEEPKGGMDELGVNAMKPLANRKVVIGCLDSRSVQNVP